jgi:hypothetical protein
MKKVISVLICIVLAAGAIICRDAFAQRSVNVAQEAATKAREGLAKGPHKNSSQIDWLDNVVNVINMEKPDNSKEATTKGEK